MWHFLLISIQLQTIIYVQNSCWSPQTGGNQQVKNWPCVLLGYDLRKSWQKTFSCLRGTKICERQQKALGGNSGYHSCLVASRINRYTSGMVMLASVRVSDEATGLHEHWKVSQRSGESGMSTHCY